MIKRIDAPSGVQSSGYEASPLAGKAAQAPQVNDKEIRRQIAVIRSMTPGERRYPKSIDASRKRRIATGYLDERGVSYERFDDFHSIAESLA